MPVLIFTILELIAAMALLIFGAYCDESGKSIGIPILIVSIIWLCVGWIPFLSLKILKPQEALVLTLFGKYIGTLKGEGFYAVNPFCASVNPAAKTKLNQSGDVNTVETVVVGKNAATVQTVNNKLSLKIMTLNNNKRLPRKSRRDRNCCHLAYC